MDESTAAARTNAYSIDVLNLAISLGYCLSMSGAEIYRVEETANRLLSAYGVPGDAFAIPSCLIVTVHPDDGPPHTRMRRILSPARDIDAIERFSALSRRICAETPPLDEARQMVRALRRSLRHYALPVLYGGYYLSAAAFALFFGGTLLDALLAGLCGVLCGALLRFLSRLAVNDFFKNIVAAFSIGVVSQTLTHLGVIRYADATAIGALMLLVPGLSFTDSMRDIIHGDTLSGLNRLAQSVLTAVSLLLGTGAALYLSRLLYHSASVGSVSAGIGFHVSSPWWFQCLAAAVACLGYSIIFNTHSLGVLICIAGGGLSWGVYLLSVRLGAHVLFGYFLAAAAISLYAEIMARVRKYPSSSYLIIALLPMVPGAGVYYTVEYLLSGQSEASVSQLLLTGCMAGMLAVGVLMVSTLFRMGTSARALSRRTSIEQIPDRRNTQ